MTATDELRRLLDERVVEYGGSDAVVYFEDKRGYKACAYDAPRRYGDGVLCVCHTAIPEQAIEATLGRGTCRDVRSTDHTIAFECSECGCWVAYDEYWETGIYVLHETGQEHIHPHYCPNCGRRVEQ